MEVTVHEVGARGDDGDPAGPLLLHLVDEGRVFFFFKQKTAYDISECDWSSDVCSPIRRSSDPSQKRHTRFLNVTGVQTCALPIERKSTRLNSSHIQKSRMPSSA